MADKEDDPFDDDEDGDLDEFNQLCDRLFERVMDFADEEDVSDELLPVLLLRLSLTTRMTAYVTSVAKPSGGGLKLDLDRYRRDIDDIIRDAKKEADQTVANMKEALAKATETDDGQEA